MINTAPPVDPTSKNLNDPVSYGIQRQIGNRVQIKFPHEICAVSLSSLHAEFEGDCYFLAGLTFGEELNNFTLSRGQNGFCRGLGFVFPTQVAVQDHLGDLGREERSPI